MAAAKIKFGATLKKVREDKGMSQQALATATGLSMSLVSMIEQGKKSDPRLSTALALAKALGVTIEQLTANAHGETAVEEKPAGKKGKALLKGKQR
jgi:transcriptional regulator with XRE-family HTH domain